MSISYIDLCSRHGITVIDNQLLNRDTQGLCQPFYNIGTGHSYFPILDTRDGDTRNMSIICQVSNRLPTAFTPVFQLNFQIADILHIIPPEQRVYNPFLYSKTKVTEKQHTLLLACNCVNYVLLLDYLEHLLKVTQGMIRKTFRYRLYPNKEQIEKFQWTLDRCRELYNVALQERRDIYNVCKHHPNYYDSEWRKQHTREYAINFYAQSKQLPEIKEIREEYKDIYAQVLVDILGRVDRTFKAFFARCRRGDTPGYPRFKGTNQFDSFTYPQVLHTKNYATGPKIEGVKVNLPKIGRIKIKLHRPIEGQIKTVTIKREVDKWYVYFSCEIEQPEPLPLSYEDVGIDLGVSKLASLSTGEAIEHPCYYRKVEKKLVKLHQSLDRKKHGSNRRKQAKQALSKAYQKTKNQRRDFLHKESRKIVNRFQVIVFEDIQTDHLTKRPKPKQDAETGIFLPNNASAKAGLNKSINDAGWSQFVNMCLYKAANAGRTLLQVNPRYTSQMCSACGAIVKKDLSERWHSCTCGCELDRDHNAAINILALGRSVQGNLRSPQGSRHQVRDIIGVSLESREIPQ